MIGPSGFGQAPNVGVGRSATHECLAVATFVSCEGEKQTMTTKARDYTDFDMKMLALIDAGTDTAASLTAALDADAKPLMNRPKDEFRVVDRRLQALRKKGVIAWERRGAFVVWSLTK